MRVIGLAGSRGSGKTSLMIELVGVLSERGLRVSTMTRARRPDEIDRPGKDSFRHRAAGAAEVMVTSAKRWALIHCGGEGGLTIDDALSRMTPVDLVIVEDVEAGECPALEVRRARAAAGPPLCRGDSRIVAVASDAPLDDASLGRSGVPVIDLADVPAIADFIVGHLGLEAS